jgi:hypothetical protein
MVGQSFYIEGACQKEITPFCHGATNNLEEGETEGKRITNINSRAG